MADVFAPQPVKTKVAGDVVVNINSGQTLGLVAGSAVVGKVGIDQTTPGTTNLVALAANQSVNTAQINGVATLIGNGVTGTGSQRVTIASDNTPFSVKIDQTTPGTTNAVQLTAGSATIGALTANQSVNTAQINGVAPAMGAGNSSTGTQRVVIATDQGTIPVSTGLSFTTGDSGHLTSAALAAGATVTLDGPQIASGTGKLFKASVSSSVAIKAQLGTWDGTTFTVRRTFFIPANATFLYVPTRYDAITMATGATARFRWSITNNDNTNAADVYASITHAI